MELDFLWSPSALLEFLSIPTGERRQETATGRPRGMNKRRELYGSDS